MPLRPPKWDYRGLSALIIAASLGLSLFTAVVGIVITGRQIGPGGGEVVAAVTGAMVGIVSAYIVGRRKSNDEDPDAK